MAGAGERGGPGKIGRNNDGCTKLLIPYSFYDLKGENELEYRISAYKDCSPDDILPLYAAVGWTNYTSRPEMLMESFEHSLCTLAAWKDRHLVGVIRAVGDGYSTVLIQDLLVHPDFQRQGIGTALLTALVERFPNVYQMALLTDDVPRSRGFYEANGFAEVSSLGCLAYVRMN